MATTKNKKMEKEGKQCLKNVSVEEVKQVFAQGFHSKTEEEWEKIKQKS